MIFQHPCLTRGVVKTAKGAFVVTRGLVEAPDEIGESLGWRPVGVDESQAEPSPAPPPEQTRRAGKRRT